MLIFVSRLAEARSRERRWLRKHRANLNQSFFDYACVKKGRKLQRDIFESVRNAKRTRH